MSPWRTAPLISFACLVMAMHASQPAFAKDAAQSLTAAQCLLEEGYRRKASDSLDQGLALARTLGNKELQLKYLLARAHLRLQGGDGAGALDDLAHAKDVLAQDDAATRAQVLHETGNAYALGEQFPQAIEAFRGSLAADADGRDAQLFVANQLNLARAALDQNVSTGLDEALRAADGKLQASPSQSGAAEQWVALGELYFRLDQAAGRWDHLDRAMQVLNKGRTLAIEQKDARTESFALGYMGRIAEEAKQSAAALEYSRLAAQKARSSDALDGLYQWQWQIARLLERSGDGEGALFAYQQSIDTLSDIRPELSQRSIRSFQAAVVPVFFGMSDLLLRQQSQATDPAQSMAKLRLVRDTIEQLKIAEIQNYFNNDCVIGEEHATQLDEVAQDSAILYPILFDDRLELLVSIGTTMRRYTSKVTRAQLTSTVLEFRRGIERRPTNRYRVPGKSLYDWLVAPALPDLRKAGVTTLVFVPDGPLRTVPIAAFYDGSHFLVEEFATATTLGMTLTSPRHISSADAEVLASGITQAVGGFAALPAVQAELDGIREIYPQRAREFQDETFRVNDVAAELARGRYSIVHIATHGQFKADHRQSFLLAYDGPLSMSTLESTVGSRRYNNEPIELLMLSACETAAGDDRAALGLAGVALKAGARSAVATLWAINDDATSQLVRKFYSELNSGKATKAQALRTAQLQLIRDQRYSHPAVWSPFLLLGNWL